MKEEIIPIVESYLENRRLKKGILDSVYKEKLISINVPESKINDFILNMDDVWTEDQFFRLKLKNAKAGAIAGYSVAGIGLLITLLTAFGILFDGQIFIFFYGAIGGGLIAGIAGQSAVSKIKHKMEMRKFKWKYWS